MSMENIYLAIPLAPLLGAIIAGLFGKIIGRVGKSGNATGFHLHYEIRLQGTPVNPRSYL